MASQKSHGLLFELKHLDAGYKLNSPSPTERGETLFLEQANSAILKIGAPITVKVGKWTFDDVYGANKVEGTPKADIALVCYNKTTKKFYDACFISHKLGASAKDFQQYSGITTKADGSKVGSISKDKSVIAFLRKISAVQDNITEKKERFFQYIKDKVLVAKSIYGPEFGAAKYTTDNIHVIGQGNVTFVKSGTAYALKFSAGQHYNPDVSEFMAGSYAAILSARYTAGRNYEVDGKTYTGARILIMPRPVLGAKAQELV